MVLGIQIIGIFVALGLLYVTFLHYRKGYLNIYGFLFWEVAWLAGLSVTIFPNIFEAILRPLSVVRVLDLITILGIMFLASVTYYNHLVVKKTEKRVEKLVRKIANENVHTPSQE